VISRDLELGGKSSLGVLGSSGKDREVRVFGRSLYLFVDVPEVGLLGRRKMGNSIKRVKGGVVLLKLVVRSLDL
jgi:hypothetical protein